ncbi:MFS general substrate transporter [Hypoxylon trugodes]|uniref:MFS general substrate transporter n=1 Tax=Hypoxylon trugodes TaxID=326681 RepID=UPI0021924717|nr:MFS general substrate transporter [Hypoxylon trugodes]KAI1384605.1 MFS general substrate transporter [Hypoxylon trugodes]
MTSETPIHAEETAETAPLLRPNTSNVSNGVQVNSNGTFPDSSKSVVSISATEDVENGQTSDSDGDAPKEDAPKLKVNMKALLPALAIGIFLVAMDQTLTIATYGKIGSDLNALNSTSWISTSYFLTLTAFQPLYGRLSDIFGRKEALLFAYAVFGIGCLGCGLSRDILQLCISRAVAGVGGGGMNAVVTILMTDIVALRDRGVWQGYINIVFASGMSSGAPIGGLVADSIGWRWAFAGQFPIAMVAWLAVFFVLNLPRIDHSHWTAKVLRIDFLGAFVLVAAVFALLFGLDNGSNEGWDRSWTVVPLALTPLLFGLFLLIETKVAAEPFAPGHIIMDPPLLAAYGANLFGVAAQISVPFFLALFFQAAMGLSATVSGLLFLPSTFFGLAGSLSGGLLMRRTGKYYWLTMFGYGIMVLSVVPMVMFTGAVAKSTLGVVLGSCILAYGSGMSITTTLIAIIANTSTPDVAVAIACSYLFRSLGSSLGISTSTAVLQQVLRTGLAESLGADGGRAKEIEEGVRQSLDYIRGLEPAVAEVVRACYAVAVQWAYAPVAIMAVSALAAAAFVREKKLEGR